MIVTDDDAELFVRRIHQGVARLVGFGDREAAGDQIADFELAFDEPAGEKAQVGLSSPADKDLRIVGAQLVGWIVVAGAGAGSASQVEVAEIRAETVCYLR